MRAQRGPLPGDVGSGNDNHRIKRYLAKLTTNPARIYGIDHEVRLLEAGQLADVVLWEPKFFGIKPEVVFEGGFPVWSVVGESNASLTTWEPLLYRPQWGAHGPACQDLSVTFATRSAIDEDVAGRWSLRKRLVPACNPRGLTERDMLHNDTLPAIQVDPETYRVAVDGELRTCEPVARVPLGRRSILK